MGLILASLDMLLALVLASAALHKIVAAERLSAASARLLGVSITAGRMASLLAAAWEGIAAIALLWDAARPLGHVMAALLWLLYAALTARAKRHGDTFDCGCSFGSKRRGADPLAVSRSLSLALLAALAAFVPVAPDYAPAAILAGIAFYGLMTAATEIAAILPLARRRTA